MSDVGMLLEFTFARSRLSHHTKATKKEYGPPLIAVLLMGVIKCAFFFSRDMCSSLVWSKCPKEILGLGVRLWYNYFY